jgi:hypothetical protein
MSTIAQKPRPPITNGHALRGLPRTRVFAIHHRERTTGNPKREVPVADQLTRERGDRGCMTEEQDPFVGPSKAPLYLGNEGGQKARETIVQGDHAFAFAGRIPN